MIIVDYLPPIVVAGNGLCFHAVLFCLWV